MESMRCDKCQYWEDDRTESEKGRGDLALGSCARAMPFWEATDWEEVGDDIKRVLKTEFADRRFFAQDGSDYNATVITTPDFFCAEFKAII